MPKTLQHSIYFLLFLLVFLPGNAQTADSTSAPQEVRYDESMKEPLNLGKNGLKQYKIDPEFDYREEIPVDNWWSRFNNWLSEVYNSFIEWILQGREARGILKFLVQALPYLFILGVLAFLVWLFIKIDMGGGSPLLRNGQGSVIYSTEEQLIKSENIQQLIDQAIKENNYRLAVRYYYLLLLQQMSQRDIIDWQVQKTNHEYSYEITDIGLKNQFIKLTRIYDFIWYGSFEVNDTAFAKAQQEFVKTTNQL